MIYENNYHFGVKHSFLLHNVCLIYLDISYRFRLHSVDGLTFLIYYQSDSDVTETTERKHAAFIAKEPHF